MKKISYVLPIRDDVRELVKEHDPFMSLYELALVLEKRAKTLRNLSVFLDREGISLTADDYLIVFEGKQTVLEKAAKTGWLERVEVEE